MLTRTGPMRINHLSAGLMLAACLLLAINQAEVECNFFDSMGSAFGSAGSMLKYTTVSVLNAASSIGRSISSVPRNIAGAAIRNTRQGVVTGRSILEGSSDESPQNETNAQFQSLCLFQRTPSWTKNPTIHFFAYKKHNAATLGCNESIKINLNISSIYDDTDNDEFLEANGVHDANLKRDLIDSGLYNATAPTFLLVHGFLASWDSDTWMCKVKDLILNSTEANVFIVDWSGGSKPLLPIDYSASVSNTKYVGQLVADFITELQVKSRQANASSYHLIGHSLGAHISGYIGYAVGSIGRITALDPAGPCFSVLTDSFRSQHPDLASRTGYLDTGARRLSPESAEIVIALHTDTTFFGLSENCAHYDIYVNGGVKQPECSSLNPVDRLSSLVSLNLGEAFDFNVACAHSYAHDLLDSFGTQLGSTILGPDVHKEDGSEFELYNDTCSPMAYRCSSYAAFKAGECGFCDVNSSDCVFAGLDFNKSHEIELLDQVHEMEKEEAEHHENSEEKFAANEDQINEIDAEDDDDFNDEDEDEEGEDGNGASNQTNSVNANRMVSQHSHGRHFIRSGAGSPTCLYHYQIVIATAASQNARDRRHYYLQFPLDSGKYNRQNNANSRLVQISHMISEDSPVFSQFQNEYANSVLAKINPTVATSGQPQSRQRRSTKPPQRLMLKRAANTNEQLDFYTALITFTPKPQEECADGTNGMSSEKRDKWYLCRPLDKLQVAHLWSADKNQLEEVQWVSLNYMSGLSHEIRESNSYILTRNETRGIVERDTVDSANRPTVSDLGQVKSPLTNPIGSLLQPVDCLVSVLNQSGSGKSNTNLKCRRSASEMKYAIELKPID